MLLLEMKCNSEFVSTGALEDAGVAVAVSLSEGLHHSVNLLGFTRQTETPKELSAVEKVEVEVKSERTNFAIKAASHSKHNNSLLSCVISYLPH